MAYEYELLPPIVQDVLPPFTGLNRLYFTVGNSKALNSIENGNIQTIQICIQEQNLKTKKYETPNYYTFSTINSKNTNSFRVEICNIPTIYGDHYIFIPNDFCPHLDTFYKFQIRWSKLPISTQDETEDILDTEWSEWSKICLRQRITKPQIHITSPFSKIISGNSSTTAQQISFSPYKITGWLQSSNKNKQILKSVNINLYDATSPKKQKFILSSGEIAPYNDVGFAYVLPKQLQQSIKYRLVIHYTTQSGYSSSDECYFISISRGVDNNPVSISLFPNPELGKMKIILYILKKEKYEGNFVIRRTSNQSKFTEWEDVQIIQFISQGDEKNTSEVEINGLLYNVYEWEDKTIDCGIYYKYGAAPIKQNGWRGTFIKTPTSAACHFEDIYLMGDNKQLRIRFDPAISNLKQNFSENLQTTLGSKYPFITRQGENNYKTFTLSGLITSYMDTYNHSVADIYNDSLTNHNANDNLVFIGKVDYFGRLIDEQTGVLIKDIYNNDIYINRVAHDENGWLCYPDGTYIKDFVTNQVIKKFAPLQFNNESLMGEFQTFEGSDEIKDFTSKEQLYNKGFTYDDETDSPLINSITYNATNDIQQYEDIMYERLFREKVLEFLNKNSVKLFRSNTEGVMLIKLMNVSLTPKQELGRMLYSFSAEAVEIDDYNIFNCDKYNIQTIGKYKEISHVETVMGQVMQTFTPEDINFTTAKFTLSNKRIKDSGIDIIKIILNKYKNNWKYQPCVPTNQTQLSKIKAFHDMYDIQSEKIQSLKIEIYSPPGLIRNKEYWKPQKYKNEAKNIGHKDVISGYLLNLDYENLQPQRIVVKANLQRKDAKIEDVNEDGLRARDRQFMYVGTYCIQNPSTLQHLVLIPPPVTLSKNDKRNSNTPHLGITVNIEYTIKIKIKQYDSVPVKSKISTNVGQISGIFKPNEDIISKIKNNYYYYLGNSLLNEQQAFQDINLKNENIKAKNNLLQQTKRQVNIKGKKTSLSSVLTTLREMSSILAMSFDTADLNAVLKVKTSNWQGIPNEGTYNNLETHVLNMGYLKLSDINLQTAEGITFNQCCFAGVLLTPTTKIPADHSPEDLYPNAIKAGLKYPRQGEYILVKKPPSDNDNNNDDDGAYSSIEEINKQDLIPNGVYTFKKDYHLSTIQEEDQSQQQVVTVTNDSIYIDSLDNSNNALILNTNNLINKIYYKNNWYPFQNGIVQCPVQAIVNYIYEGGTITYQLVES